MFDCPPQRITSPQSTAVKHAAPGARPHAAAPRPAPAPDVGTWHAQSVVPRAALILSRASQRPPAPVAAAAVASTLAFRLPGRADQTSIWTFAPPVAAPHTAAAGAPCVERCKTIPEEKSGALKLTVAAAPSATSAPSITHPSKSFIIAQRNRKRNR